MDFFGIKKKLEEGFGSLTGNIGNLFNRGVSTVGGVANNVLQQARPAAQQASQQWSNLQSTGNTLRQQAQNLTNDAINATTRDIGNFDLADSISSRAQDLGYSKRDQFSDLNKFRGGDLSALANPLLKAGNQGLDFQKGINQAPWQVAANLPRAAAATGTLVNMAQEPVNRAILGEENARKIRENQDLSVKGLYSAGDEISKFGTNLPWTKQSDPDSAVSKGGKIVGDIGLSIVGGAPSKAVSIPYYLTQAQGRVAGDVQKKTGDLNKAAIAGSVYAPVETALERFSVGKVLDGGGNLASRFARGYVSEGGTEAAQQFAENLTKNKVADPNQSLTEGVAESGLIGGLVGGGVSGLNSSRPTSTDFTKQLDRELDGLNSAIMPPAQAPSISEQPQVNAPEQINTQPQAPVVPQVPQAPVQPVQPVQQPQVTQPTVMSEADTQQLQNTQRGITRSQPLSGQPESIAQLLQNKQIPQENVANQQALGEAKVQAQDLANLYKIDPATAQRLIENYGYANVAALAQEVSKSGTARSVDAVVVSEAVKRWGKPRSQMTDAELASLDQTPEAQQANTVATQPTQTVPQEQQPVMDAEAQSYVANQVVDNEKISDVWNGKAPESSLNKAELAIYNKDVDRMMQLPSMDDANVSNNTTNQQTPSRIVDTSTGEVTSRDQVIANADTQMRNFIDTKILPAIEGQPFTAEQFTKEIQEADRNGTNPSPAVARFYDKNIAPLIKAMARNAKREDVLKRRWYLPQFKAGKEQQINVGGSLVNKIDVDEFGFAKARENKIPLDQLDYSFDGLVRLAVQEAAYKARHTIRASEVMNTQAERGIEITEKQAEKVSRLEESTAKELNKNAEDPGQLEKTDILGRMKILGKAQNETQRVLDKGMWKIDRLTDSRDNLLTKVEYTDSAGNQTDIYQGMGFYLFDRSEGVGHQVFSELYAVDGNDVITSSPSFEQTVDRLQTEYADVNLPQGVKDMIIQDFAFKSSNTVDTTSVDTSVKREAFVRLQKRMARELLSQELKTVDVQNKQLYKLLNGESQRVLMQDNFERTLGEKIINATTGTFYRGYLALNPRSALMQLLEINRLQALLGPKLAAHGVKMAAQDLNITKKYGIRETRFEDVNEFKNSDNTSRGIQMKDKASNVLMYMFNKGEQIKDAAFLHALEADADAKGLTSTEKTRYVLDNFHKYAIKYGQEGSIGINKTKSGRLLFQFLQFGIKSTRIRLSKVVDIVGPDRTSQTRRQAGAYLARDAAGSAALYLIMSAAIGATWEEMMGYFNPFEDRNTDKNKSTAEAVVGVIPGGPLTSSLKNIYFAMMQEARAAEKEGRPVNPENYINTQVKKNIAGLIPGGHQLINKTGVQALLPDGSTVKEFFKDQGAISDMQRGYNQSPTGRARFISPETPQDIAKALIFGQYSTGPAREYFGSQNVAGDLEIAKKLGVDWIGPRDNNFPVGDRFQKKIDAGENPGSVIIRSRAYDKKKEDFKDSNPAQQAILNEINKTTYNPATGKNESDVISPEKWDKVNSDTSLKLFERLREKAIDDNREFGYAIDPIYTLKDPQQIREILKIRSLPTGDDTELKQMNTAKHKWYRDFADKEKAYFETIKAKNFEESDEYGPTERKKAYIDSGSQYPQHTDLVKRYFDIKEKDANAGKEFYKNNRDQLAKDFDANKKAAFEWTNKRRALEGAQPLTWEAFNNVTFGYEDDEAKVFKQLGFKLGEFGSGSDKGYNAYRKAKSFSQPTIRIAAPKPGALKVPKPNVKKANYKVPKIVVRRSKA